MSETRDKIINVAERMIREGGYHSFSFRQIADELNLKSSSIHYYFPSKEDLGVVVTSRYTANFLGSLGNAKDRKDGVKDYIAAFESSLELNRRACLCGVLAAESGRLPHSMLKVLEDFSNDNLKWLTESLETTCPNWELSRRREMSLVIFSALEGAMTFSAMTGQSKHLHQVGTTLMNLLTN